MRKTLILLSIACAGLSLPADIINWMVDGSEQDQSTFCYAQFVAEKEGSPKVYLKVADPSTAQPVEYMGETTPLVLAGDAVTPNVWSYLDSGAPTWAGYSFFVELLNEDEKPILKSTGGLSYSDLVAHIKSSQLDQPTVLKVGSFSPFPVPEPTSGLMLLLGMSLLALRRKRT